MKCERGKMKTCMGAQSSIANYDHRLYITQMRNARASPGVLLVFSCNGIDVIFLIKKLHLCHPKGHRCNFLITSMPLQENTRRTPGDVLAFLYTNIGTTKHGNSSSSHIDTNTIIIICKRNSKCGRHFLLFVKKIK
jgi:hypothetical protein